MYVLIVRMLRCICEMCLHKYIFAIHTLVWHIFLYGWLLLIHVMKPLETYVYMNYYYYCYPLCLPGGTINIVEGFVAVVKPL